MRRWREALHLIHTDGITKVHVLLPECVDIVLFHDCNVLMILQSFFLVRLSFEAMVVGMDSVMKAISFKLISS